jgi:hypothetical protein
MTNDATYKGAIDCDVGSLALVVVQTMMKCFTLKVQTILHTSNKQQKIAVGFSSSDMFGLFCALTYS